MKLLEFLDQKELEAGYYDPAQDEVNMRVPTDTRKPILTLRHLNRLKRIRALRTLQDLKKQDLLSIMYASPDDAAAGGGMMGGPAF